MLSNYNDIKIDNSLNIAKTYSDIDMTFTINPATNDIAKKTGSAAIKQSIKNLVLLNFYEKPFNPNISGIAYAYLFEREGDLIGAEDSIKETLLTYEPRVEDVSVSISTIENDAIVSIYYRLKVSQNIENLKFILNINR